MDWSKGFTIFCGVMALVNMAQSAYWLLRHDDFQKATFYAVLALLLVK